MGKFEMRNTFLSSKLKQTKVRLLIIDDNQIRYNQIVELLNAKGYQVDAFLLDDLKSFEKQLQTNWDIVLFGRAYDLKVEQALTLIHASTQPQLPLLLLNPENYEPSQYLSYINKGVYDLFNLDYPDRFYIGLVRTLSYSRAVQTQQHLVKELEVVDAQIKIQTQENHKAVALIQEGIHIQANHEYFTLFGFNSEDDIIGMPLLDVIQPKNTAEFKQRFKRISQNNFDQANFEITSQNEHLHDKNTLKLEFFPDSSGEGVQLSIDMDGDSAQGSDNLVHSHYEPINRRLQNESANCNSLIVFKLSPLPKDIHQFNQQNITDYLTGVYKFIQEQMHNVVVKLTPSTYISLCQAASEEALNSKVMGLEPLTKPQLLEIAGANYPVQFKIGSCALHHNIQSQEEFDFLFSQALVESATDKSENGQKLEFSLMDEETVQNTPAAPDYSGKETKLKIEESHLDHLTQALEKSEIHLKYQQLYDKQDENLFIYEVTSGIIHDNKWLAIGDLNDLHHDSDLSIKVDRWILVEACKQLNNFVIQYPQSKLIINLNIEILLHDNQLLTLVSKLLSIMSNAQKDALILQFNAQAVHENLQKVQPILNSLQEQQVAVSLRHFGINEKDSSLLTSVKPDLCYLDSAITNMLNNEKELATLQQQIESYQEISEIDLILPFLDNMTTFANAWNVDARYLQGDYFQKKLDHLIDVQDN